MCWQYLFLTSQTLKRKEIRQHMNDTPINHVSLLLQYVMAFVIQLGNFVLRPEFTTTLRRLVKQVTAVRAYYFKKFVMLYGKITGLERRIECLEVVVVAIVITPSCPQSYNGTLLWRLDNFNRKRQDAINGVKNVWYSPPFYSSQYGYKMCAKIYMNGDSRRNGTHLSLFFVIMKGDYDALQTLSFQNKITMLLMAQGIGDHMIDAFHSDPQSSLFQGPVSDLSLFGLPVLISSIESLSNLLFIKEDTMFIKLIVE
ncbi:TNF receptor-associated factor 3-like [Xenia sp. Carnegie-2017]|uniref:TNF receptor-associated factor 3-like n=1 Tax=Xenia sp. Carnegie-2017 TaxID=2897299 RepID=UPI001F038268|nr:TNF receptor-associated factor 3-like [Xenia sp. Carnegie-2017]